MFQKISILLLLYFFTNFNAQSKADQILGDWISTDNSVAVKIFKIDDEYEAKIIWFNEKLGNKKPMHHRYDSANPNPKLRFRKIIGMEILNGLYYSIKSNTWENGKIYDASSGRTWDSAIDMMDNGSLKVRGYWKFKWIGKTMTFKRLK